jgi:ribosomal protein L16/L10AE
VPITIFDSDTIPRDRRIEFEAAVVAAGKHLSKRFEGWIVATPDRPVCRANNVVSNAASPR